MVQLDGNAHWHSPLIYKGFIPKFMFGRNFIMQGSSKFTSMSSIVLRNTLPFKPVSWLPRAWNFGGQLGRAAAGVGWYITIGQVLYYNWQDMNAAQKRDVYRIAAPGGFVPSNDLETLPTKF